MAYDIKVELIPGLPKIPYTNGVGNYQGVVAHATANNGDTAEGERSFESRTWGNAFVHFFVDDAGIIQTADINYICYGAGPTANHKGFVQIELCQTTDQAKFESAYAKYTWLIAKVLHDKKLGVIDNKTLLSHKEASDDWHESSHQDPIDYLKSHGKAWTNFIDDVTAEYSKLDPPAPAPKPVTPAPQVTVAPTPQPTNGGLKKVKNIVVYGNSIDQRAAEYLADFFNCPAISLENFTPDVDAAVENVYMVGGGKRPCDRATVISGDDRFNTAIAVFRFMKKIN